MAGGLTKKSSFATRMWWRLRVDAAYIAARFQNLPRRFPRECNICGYEGYFGPAGRGRRVDAKCPRCKSAERYRLFKLWLDNNDKLLRGKDVLHFAPEGVMARLIKPLAGSYRSADIAPSRADLVLNIEAIDLPDASLDCVVCSHVLEHVDDAKALAEIHRVLRPGGSAVILIPIAEGWDRSYENPQLTSRSDRTLHFGQYDHVRIYGRDVRERVRNAGFSLGEFAASGADTVRFGLMRGERVFLATKPA